MTPDTDTNNPPPVQPGQPPVAGDVDMLEAAWGLIANAWGGDWHGDEVGTPCADQRTQWREAAERWRDKYHARIRHAAGADGWSETPPSVSGDYLVQRPDETEAIAAWNRRAAPPAPAPAPVAAAKTMPLDDYLLLSGMLRISQQHARAWGLYDEQGNPIYPAGVLSHPFQADKLPATADAPALLRASLVQPATVAATDADLDALEAAAYEACSEFDGRDGTCVDAESHVILARLAQRIVHRCRQPASDADTGALLTLVRGMVETVKAGEWTVYPGTIRRLGELVERVAARCRQAKGGA